MTKRIAFWLFLSFLVGTSAFAQTAQSEISRFVYFYGDEVERTGFKPDEHSTRESRIAFLQQTVKRFCSPLLAMKRADPSRPISDEVVVFVQLGPEYRVFSDFIPNGGSSAWRLSDHLEGALPIAQPLVNPLTLGRLAEASFVPTVPGCTPPGATPSPTPTPPVCPPQKPCPLPPVVQPYPDENVFWTAYERQVALVYFEAGLPFPDNSAAFRWFTRAAYDIRDGMTKEAAAAKHLAALRAAVGLPQ